MISKAEMTSNLESDDNGPRKRRKPKNFSDSSDESEAPQPKRKKTINKKR